MIAINATVRKTDDAVMAMHPFKLPYYRPLANLPRSAKHHVALVNKYKFHGHLIHAINVIGYDIHDIRRFATLTG